jgi:putative membrane protein
MNKDLILRENLALQRTIMANQTTLLSFVRTSMYFLVAGISVQNVVRLAHLSWVFYLFYAISAGLLLGGIFNYFRQKRLIEEARKMVGNAQQAYVL